MAGVDWSRDDTIVFHSKQVYIYNRTHARLQVDMCTHTYIAGVRQL